MQNIKVAVWGFGAMGSGIVSTLLNKTGVDVVGVCDNHPDRVGKSIFGLLGVDRADRADLRTCAEIDAVVRPGQCDICVIATDSFVERICEKVLYVLGCGVNVVTLAEEMSFPWAKYPELSAKMDAAARQNGVSVMGTGINPGLVMDLLAICLSGAMTHVDSVRCKRVNSLSPFGRAVMTEQGVGLSVADFEAGMASGHLTGHVGFAESVAMIDKAMGLGVDQFRQQMSPIVTTVDRKSPYGAAAAGDVAGVNMTGQGLRGQQVVIDMIHPQQIEPGDEGVKTGDYIELRGTPPIHMAIQPEIDGGLGTIAMCVNCIPAVINADPGLITMIDIPVPRAIMDDFRNHVKPQKKLV
jgi:4-hydroxy-tetrahydrodipicolinate reductase